MADAPAAVKLKKARLEIFSTPSFFASFFVSLYL
jgi:hypothetical protein